MKKLYMLSITLLLIFTLAVNFPAFSKDQHKVKTEEYSVEGLSLEAAKTMEKFTKIRNNSKDFADYMKIK